VRIFLDTNVWLAAFLTHGGCHDLVEYCLESHVLLISEGVLKEIENKLKTKFQIPKSRREELVAFIRDNTRRIETPALNKPVCRDPQDDHILASASGGQADCLITGDQDLLVLRTFQGIPILKPNDFWKFEKS